MRIHRLSAWFGALLKGNDSSNYELLTYVLTTNATVEEVKTKLPKILVNQSALGSYGGWA